MRTVSQRVLLVLLMVLTLPSIRAAADKSFKTVARDKDGKPVPGITLSVLSGGNKFAAGVTGSNGEQNVSLDLGGSQAGQSAQIVVRKCLREDGTEEITDILFLQPGAQALPAPPEKKCKDYPAGYIPWPGGDGVVVTVDVDSFTAHAENGARTAKAPETDANATVRFEAGVYGGAGVINGNSGYKFLFDGAIPIRVGPVSVGPEFGGEFLRSTVIQTFGSMSGSATSPTTFGNVSVGMKNARIGGRFEVPFNGFQINVDGGALVASLTATQTLGVCGGSLGAGCETGTPTVAHDTKVGSFVGTQLSHTLGRHAELAAGWTYDRVNDGSVADLHANELFGGVRVRIGGSSK